MDLSVIDIFILLFLTHLSHSIKENESWRKPGCHKIGFTRKVTIPDCVEFRIKTNGCRGYCESWSIPSSSETLLHPKQSITSVGHCCNIMDTEDIKIRISCLDGVREITFKSAMNCSCYHCKKE